MSIAELIAMELTKQEHAACTLQGGYLVLYNGDRRTFPPARIIYERRNREGRCVRLIALYEDLSRLRFEWDPAKGGSYTVIEEGDHVPGTR